jgi:hypothetical protein
MLSAPPKGVAPSIRRRFQGLLSVHYAACGFHFQRRVNEKKKKGTARLPRSSPSYPCCLQRAMSLKTSIGLRNWSGSIGKDLTAGSFNAIRRDCPLDFSNPTLFKVSARCKHTRAPRANPKTGSPDWHVN